MSVYADSMSPYKWTPSHLEHVYFCFNQKCKKQFVLKTGVVYPFYDMVNGGLHVVVRPYCSLTCLCIAETPHGVG
jgi:hypothetical protein